MKVARPVRRAGRENPPARKAGRASRPDPYTQAEAAHRHRVTRELFSCPDYTLPSSWARALHLTGFDALLYEPRFGPGPGRAVALFGTHGRDRNREILSSVELSHTLQNMGLLPSIPSSRELRCDDSDAETATTESA